jgi:predicted GNAT family acetyltransferase
VSAIKHDPNAHRFTTEVNGSRAQLDYTLQGGVMTITHTGVPPAIGGRGVAAQLMREALSAAHSAGWSVNPVCSYAAAYMARHPRAAGESSPAGDSPSANHSPSAGGSS